MKTRIFYTRVHSIEEPTVSATTIVKFKKQLVVLVCKNKPRGTVSGYKMEWWTWACD